ncbi:MAG TPA: hypothetical protein ENO27_00980 [Caldithrix sp.]|nr:hypothetical protein [Calditrichaceae bacterium]HEM48759.1 hypothetical protein [Caldithrix sp.]HES59609.1 hypothetical protein [Caldithrix sp.]
MNTLLQSIPETIGDWQQCKEVQQIDSSNIFDYMNGGAELYLGYRFNHLEVLEYSSEDKNTILVEIYQMETSDDAFGLLSIDWSGEQVMFNQTISSDELLAPEARALYGGGLLRMATGKYYIRILAFRETTDAKSVIMQLGKLLYKDLSSEPEILRQIPLMDDIGWIMNSDKITFFRSYMVLNSLFYLSHQNLLNLDHSVSAVTVSYNSQVKNVKPRYIQLLLAEYPNQKKAAESLKHFIEEFLPENTIMIDTVKSSYSHNFKVEEGWLVCKLDNNFVSIVFNIPDQLSAKQIINHI